MSLHTINHHNPAALAIHTTKHARHIPTLSRPAAKPTIAASTKTSEMNYSSIPGPTTICPETSFLFLFNHPPKQTCSSIIFEMSHQSEHSLDECRFLGLPAELREIVYDLVFDVQQGVHLNFEHSQDRRIPPSQFALSSTCKQIYHECKDLLYWLNTFHFNVPILEEPEQIAVRNYRTSTPIVLPLPQVIQSHYRKRHMATAPGNLASPNRHLREKAQHFITLAMRLPHIDQMISRLERTVSQPTLSRLRRVHVHLGSQMRHPFIERFFGAWNEVAPALMMLNTLTELRISFELRISKRLSVAYEFGVQDADKTLAEMDSCVTADDFSLPELATLNGIRVRVWGVFFGTDSAKPPAPFRPEGELGRVPGAYHRSCGIAVLDRIAFGRDMELRA